MDVQTGLLGLETPCGTTVMQSLISSEIPLPDGRDAAVVLSTAARAVAENVECGAGITKVNGRMELYIVCQTLGNETFGFTAVSSFTQAVETVGSAVGMRAEAAVQVLECNATADMFKLRLTAVLELNVSVTAPVTTPFLTEVTGARGMEIRRARIRTERAVKLAEASVRIREEAEAPNVSRILLYCGAARVDTLQYSGAAVCQADGTLSVTVLTESAAEEIDTLLIAIPFSCSFDAQYLPVTWACCHVESVSVVASDPGFGVLDAEAVLRVTLYGIESAEHEAILDAYDADASFTCQRSQVERLTYAGVQQKSFSVTESVSVPKHLPDALRPVYASAMAVVTGVFDREGHLGADVMLLTSVIYRCDEGKLFSFTEDIPIQLDFDVPFAPEARVTLTVLSAMPSGSGRTIELAFTLEGTAILYQTDSATLATELTAGCEPCPYSGILIYCAEAGETPWDVGKRFGVPMQALNVWNGELTEPLAEGRPIVLIK